MKTWWALAFGLVSGLLASGVILLVAGPPRGTQVLLSPPPTPAPLAVHVVGAVARPGVYDLAVGSRVQEAVRAAGGALAEANLEALNLAAPLVDGSQVEVPYTAAESAGPLLPGRNSPTIPIASAGLVNINSATQEELESLPGIGPVTAQKIIAYREANGPFANTEAIQAVSGIGPATFERIKDLIGVSE